jgi:asparagine synthase (glutamine-hydrolysing)
MCGIYGITAKDPEFIQSFIDICKHRGPDGECVWTSDTVTLGHNLLSIMASPDQSQQPWKTPKGNMLVYNGEIFNYYELKQKHTNFVDTTGCDTELLAWGLDTFGLNFIDEIDSMHGFAYYEVAKKQITLSRDHAGIKPVYYAEIDQGLVFGSEIKGMLDKVPGSHTVDKLAMSCLAYTGINATRNTSFSGIKKLLAGETKVYNIANRKFIETKRIFIKPTSDHHFAPIEFKKMAKKTVEMCSIGQRKIGVFLSGGLDSSLIAHELNKLKGPAITFTNKMKPNIVTEEDFNSDANAAEKLAKVEGYQHTVVKVTPDSVVDSWNDSIYYMEQPMYNQSVSMYYHTNKVLHDNGIVVTMAGDMGDEILGGYPKYWKLTQTEYIERMIGKKQIESWDDVLTLWMLRIKRPLAGFMMGGTLSKKDVFEELKKCYPDDLWNPKDPVASYMALDCVTQVPEEFFMRNDKFGMAFGMEGRFPLATKIFMQYCMSIPSFQKIGIEKFQTKLPTKRAYENVLPEIIIKKEKTGWTVPLGYWLTKGRSTRLTDFYNNALKDKGGLGIIKTSAKAGKSLVPSWIVSDWIKKYKMKI